MKNLYLLLFVCISFHLNAQFNSNTTHVFQDDADLNVVIGTQSLGNSGDYKLFIDLRPHFNILGDDEQGIKFKTGNFAIELDNSATSIDPNFDHPVFKPSGNYVGFLGKPGHRWFHIYGATIHADTLMPNDHLLNEIGTKTNQWNKIWSETVRAKSYFPEFTNTGTIGGPGLLYKEIHATEINCVTFCASSDIRLKDNFRSIDQPLQKILALKGWQYDHHIPQSTEVKKDKIGLVAQELKEIFPELVIENKESDLLSIDYMGMIPVLVEGMKEQQELINAQQEEIDELKELVNQLIEKVEERK